MNLSDETLNSLNRIARESPHAGERFAAQQAIKKQEAQRRSGGGQDPRLTSSQRQTIDELRRCGFRVTYEFSDAAATVTAPESTATIFDSGFGVKIEDSACYSGVITTA
jgi:hypothetical protein